MDQFDELPKRHKARLLSRSLEPIGIIEVPRVLGEKGEMGDIKRSPSTSFNFSEHQRRLAAAGAADDDQGRRSAKNRVLHVVEGDRLVERWKIVALSIQIA